MFANVTVYPQYNKNNKALKTNKKQNKTKKNLAYVGKCSTIEVHASPQNSKGNINVQSSYHQIFYQEN
jgi:hypothetical protein